MDNFVPLLTVVVVVFILVITKFRLSLHQ